jgi:MinD-like ATPase involved in chromosome partitioning or flagellar assembly
MIPALVAKIVSIHSFRGGTGKSNATSNLSTVIAERGYRVGVVDTDIQSPGVHVLFHLDPEQTPRTLNDYLWGKCAIHEAAYDVGSKLVMADGSVGVKGGAIYLVPSSIKASDIARVLREGYDVGLLNDGYEALLERLKLDYLFVDTHPGLNEETLLSISISEALLLLMRPDQQDFQGTAVTVDVARKLGVPHLLMVVNKVLDSFDFASVRAQVEATYKAAVAGVLPNTDDLVRLASGDIFSLRYPDHPWSREIDRIASMVLSLDD